MAAENKWNRTQSYEQAHWQEIANKLGKGSDEGLSWYTWRSKNLMNKLRKAFPGAVSEYSYLSILEVFSEPVGFVPGLSEFQFTIPRFIARN
jgi:hypothetical protein